MANPRALEEREIEILKRNKIDPENKSVVSRSEDSIHLRDHETRDDIFIYQGDRKWTTY